MKVTERDEILIRLDERSVNTWRLVEKMEKHQIEQNNHIAKNFIATSRNTIYRRIIYPIIGFGLTAFILHLIGVY